MDTRALLLPLILLATPTLADAPLPSADLPGARDSELLKRYEGAYIISYQHSEYDALRIPLSPLKPTDTAGETDAHNNRLHRPERSVTA
ncbi:hypothetical protein [Pseudomonas sp. NCCP-436]|uniref:hypothetical protein n=1 Tax=Pseudomonas sp. NCCP-436 TaxID=2842481 RepID=UPI001C821113|nr:hypothetical protein [Pseudomonas sp. NCCP-436]GIZ12940.1 hypothetical protein NCCP436_23560 [Pseudomonas sp. NCCP-436]